jgi:hypothetical protein
VQEAIQGLEFEGKIKNFLLPSPFEKVSSLYYLSIAKNQTKNKEDTRMPLSATTEQIKAYQAQGT